MQCHLKVTVSLLSISDLLFVSVKYIYRSSKMKQITYFLIGYVCPSKVLNVFKLWQQFSKTELRKPFFKRVQR